MVFLVNGVFSYIIYAAEKLRASGKYLFRGSRVSPFGRLGK